MPIDVWQEWVDYRGRWGKPKRSVLQADLKRLIELDEERNPPADVIRLATGKGWRGLYELPDNKKPKRHLTLSGRWLGERERRWFDTGK